MTGSAGDARIGVQPSDYIPTLDGWRALAIVWVIASHDIVHLQEHLYGLDGPTSLRRLVVLGPYGVDIFFALSGYLITNRLIAERRRRGEIRLGAFYLRRAFRILPAWLACLAVTAAAIRLGFPVDLRTCIWTLACLRNYVPAYRLGDIFTAHFWSLAVEEHFYLIWPAAMILAANLRRAGILALAAAIGCVVWRWADPRFHVVTGYLGIPINEEIIRTDYRIDGLLWGCLMALLSSDEAWKARLARWLSPPVLLALLAFLIGLIWVTPLQKRSPPVAPIIALLIAGTALNPESRVGRWLEWPAVRWVGRLSYSLYLWQQLFVLWAEGVPDWFLRRFPVDLVATVLVAIASYHGIERPFIRLGHRIAGRLGHRPKV